MGATLSLLELSVSSPWCALLIGKWSSLEATQKTESGPYSFTCPSQGSTLALSLVLGERPMEAMMVKEVGAGMGDGGGGGDAQGFLISARNFLPVKFI